MSATRLPTGRALGAAALVALSCALSVPASGITRDRVMTKARAFAFHPWRCEATNLSASCSTDYESAYFVGDQLGVAYDWGGFVSLSTFDQQITQGYGAGALPRADVLSCTTGVDCSGYVSECWDTGTKYGTWTLVDISREITQAELLPGDVLNDAGTHVVLFSHTLASGAPVFFEAGSFNVEMDVYGGWASVSGFVPRAYNNIEGSSLSSPVGTAEQPIEITSFPFTDGRDTAESISDVFDACAEAADTDESGPEFVYTLTLTQPGELTVAVADDTGVDIDVHLYEALNFNDCVARGHHDFTAPVDCGTYYVVADTFVDATGEQSGPYTLTVDFVPGSGSCGPGPHTYEPGGELGGTCADASGELILLCNPNLGGQICIVSPPESFCSIFCESQADCDVFPGGCCHESSSSPGMKYCLTADYCGSPDAGAPDSSVPDTATGADSATVADAARPDTAGADLAAATGVAAPDTMVGGDSGSSGVYDAGQPGADPDPGETEDMGCQCADTNGGARLGLAALALLLLGRARRRHQSVMP